MTRLPRSGETLRRHHAVLQSRRARRLNNRLPEAGRPVEPTDPTLNKDIFLSAIYTRIVRYRELKPCKTAFIEPGSPRENGYVESFNARMRDELLNREIFYSVREAQIIIQGWRNHYNTKRPHSALGYRPPASETLIPIEPRPVSH